MKHEKKQLDNQLYKLSEYCYKKLFFNYTGKHIVPKKFSNLPKLISEPRSAEGTYPTTVQLHSIEVEGPCYVDKARFGF